MDALGGLGKVDGESLISLNSRTRLAPGKSTLPLSGPILILYSQGSLRILVK